MGTHFLYEEKKNFKIFFEIFLRLLGDFALFLAKKCQIFKEILKIFRVFRAIQSNVLFEYAPLCIAKKSQKTLEKGVDTPSVKWYYMQVADDTATKQNLEN